MKTASARQQSHSVHGEFRRVGDILTHDPQIAHLFHILRLCRFNDLQTHVPRMSPSWAATTAIAPRFAPFGSHS